MPPKSTVDLLKNLSTLSYFAAREACNEDVESAYYEPWNLALMQLCLSHTDNNFMLSNAPQACLTKEAVFDTDGLAIDLSHELGECNVLLVWHPDFDHTHVFKMVRVSGLPEQHMLTTPLPSFMTNLNDPSSLTVSALQALL